MAQDLIKPFGPDFTDYLHDESRRVGKADSISFPMSEDEVIEVVQQARELGRCITTQGARTGLAAGAVPEGGHVLNLSRMTSVGEIRSYGSGSYLSVQPGVTLADVRKITEAYGMFFPPDPTETSASIGGMVACNASGALSFHYGSTRKWVRSLRVVLSDGSTLSVKRGEHFADGRHFRIGAISGQLPSYTQPKVKSAAGYYVADDMDLVDLFVGMEGTLGIVTEIELRLLPRPQAVNGLTVFMESEESALRLVEAARSDVAGSIRPVAIEFFNHDALDLLRAMKSDNPAFASIPALRPDYHTAIYLEFHGESEEELEEAVTQIMDVLAELGVSDEDTWYATNQRELEPLKAFRHATPEAVNLLIDQRKRNHPELTKLGTDMSVPDAHLADAMQMYNSALAENQLESVIFGHIGNNHVHVNILPNNIEEYDRGKRLYLSWAKRVVEMGGSISAEHGIGKLKVPFLALMYGEEAIAEMKSLKRLFDPDGILNPGNLF